MIRFADCDVWDNFIAKYKLNGQRKIIAIQKRKHVYISIGSWDLGPESIWQSAQKNKEHPIPKQQLSTIALHFAVMVRKFMSDVKVIASRDSND